MLENLKRALKKIDVNELDLKELMIYSRVLYYITKIEEISSQHVEVLDFEDYD